MGLQNPMGNNIIIDAFRVYLYGASRFHGQDH